MIRRPLTALVLLLAAVPAFAFDDPAIAVCEQVAKAEQPPNTVYRRVSATIEGRKVLLHFEVSILNTAPKGREKICEFKADANANKFTFVPDIPPRHAVCDELEKQTDEQSRRKSAAVLRADLAILEMCEKTLRLQKALLLRVRRTLADTGIHPIAATDTELR